jgi:SnoaL-like domain
VIAPEADVAIRNRYAAYCFATDDRDPLAMADCFTANAVVEVVGQSRMEGRDAIARTQETPSTNRHHVFNLWIVDADDRRAHVRTYFVISDRKGAPVGHGRYDDELVREDDGAWRFRTRAIEYFWQSDEYAALVNRVVAHANRR